MRIAIIILSLAISAAFWSIASPSTAQMPPAATNTAAASGSVDQPSDIKQPGKTALNKGTATQETVPASFKTPWEVWLTLLTAAMMVAAICVLCVVGWKANFSADFQRTFLIVIIIFASLYLIVAGYSDQQIAPVFSLFGAVIGYLFGKSDTKPAEARPQDGGA